METGPAPEAAAAVPVREVIPIEFRATGSEYFRIWIVNLLLTLLTLGIYSAWAKVRRQRYLYGSTFIAGSAFEYHGQPLQILKGRLIAVAVLVIYWGLTNFWPLTTLLLLPALIFALPWVIVRSRLFQMHMTSWRNIRFRFHGTYGGALGAYVGWAIAAGLTFYILVPLWIYMRVRYLISNTSYGTERFVFVQGAGVFFKFFFLSVLMGFIALIILGMLLGFTGVDLPWDDELNYDPEGLISFVPLTVLGLVMALGIGAFYQRSFVNACFDGLRIGPNEVRCHLETSRLAMIYITNALGILLTLGLFFPWAHIRQLKYQFDCMQLDVKGSLDEFAAASAPTTSATGEAIGEVFDVEFGL